jgi:hypothetical protein
MLISILSVNYIFLYISANIKPRQLQNGMDFVVVFFAAIVVVMDRDNNNNNNK